MSTLTTITLISWLINIAISLFTAFAYLKTDINGLVIFLFGTALVVMNASIQFLLERHFQ